jgi:hypothetical protein
MVMIKRLIEISLVVALSGLALSAQAGQVVGGFNGIVNSGSGTYAGIDLESLNGMAISGTFSFDSSALSTDGVTYTPLTPLIFSEIIGDNIFTISGNYQTHIKQLTFPNSTPSPAYVLVLMALSSDLSSTNIILGNGTGNSFLSNPSDFGSMNFSSTPTSGTTLYEAYGQTRFLDISTLAVTGFYGFSISSVYANAAPVTEVNTSAMLLVGLGLMGFMTRLRKSNQNKTI